MGCEVRDGYELCPERKALGEDLSESKAFCIGESVEVLGCVSVGVGVEALGMDWIF